LGVQPEQIKYVTLTHTHPDHIGAVPRLKRLWPHLEVVAGQVAAKLLNSEGMLREFVPMDRTLAKIMLAKGEITELPPELENYAFEADIVVKEGDRIDLGSGIAWTVYDTPGHSPCHISLYEESEGTLIIGDATGFYVPEKNVFWPNYFYSLEAYCNSIRKLSALPAQRGALSHNYVVQGELRRHFQKAISATESHHLEMLGRSRNGEDPEKIALEKAQWVNTLTDSQPFEIMYSLSKLLIKRSQSEAGKENLFTIP
jgi:glyoxylase-like metal-dependent hydrolase (beta-lactamase superfamily II)